MTAKKALAVGDKLDDNTKEDVVMDLDSGKQPGEYRKREDLADHVQGNVCTEVLETLKLIEDTARAKNLRANKKPENLPDFQKMVIGLRTFLGATQKELGKLLNVTPQTISRWESDSNHRSPTTANAHDVVFFSKTLPLVDNYFTSFLNIMSKFKHELEEQRKIAKKRILTQLKQNILSPGFSRVLINPILKFLPGSGFDLTSIQIKQIENIITQEAERQKSIAEQRKHILETKLEFSIDLSWPKLRDDVFVKGGLPELKRTLIQRAFNERYEERYNYYQKQIKKELSKNKRKDTLKQMLYSGVREFLLHRGLVGLAQKIERKEVKEQDK